MSSDSASAGGSIGARRSLDLPVELLKELVRHAQQSLPEECCGILIGTETGPDMARVIHAMPVESQSAERRDHEYLIPPLAILEAQRQARADGLEILGYYHSHPSGSAFPSALDRCHAWPETSYVILGMRGAELTEVRSWRRSVTEVDFSEEVLNCHQVET